jgi:acyl dehydratase
VSWFEELEHGRRFAAPGLTLTDGHAAVHQAIVGDRLRLALDRPLAERVTGLPGALAHPALVCDVAIGQSTVATGRVIANLFYRGLTLRRAPRIGDTLRTTTEVVALKQNGTRPSGLAVLRVHCTDQEDRDVLDFVRCAMLPLRDAGTATGHADDIAAVPAPDSAASAAIAGWDLEAFRAACPGEHFADLRSGATVAAHAGDVVSAAPELARLTLNLAAAHTDAGSTPSGQRLVYGGHTIGIAAAQLTRALPNLVYILGWDSCDHLGPVHEGDTLRTTVTVGPLEPLAAGGGVADLSCVVTADRSDGPVRVLDWKLQGALA